MDVVKTSFPDARFDLQNANGEISTASSIAQKFKAENITLAVGIATPTAQALVNSIKLSLSSLGIGSILSLITVFSNIL